MGHSFSRVRASKISDEEARVLGIRSSVGCPIFVEGRLWGVIAASSKRETPFPAETESQIGEFTELVATAVANAETRDELLASRARVVAAADDARRRIERDLHDGAQQRLVHAVITQKLALRALREGDEQAEALVSEALDHGERATSELRELAHGILPSVLTRGGLRAGVQSCVSRISLPVTVEVSGDRFPPAIEATAYFIVSEALTNAAKHSAADQAEVTAHAEGGLLRIEVRDDGVGGARPTRAPGCSDCTIAWRRSMGRWRSRARPDAAPWSSRRCRYRASRPSRAGTRAQRAPAGVRSRRARARVRACGRCS